MMELYDPWNTTIINSNINFNISDLKNASLHDESELPFDSANYCPYANQSPILNVILAILYTLVCIIGILGNSLVIYVVIKFSKMQTVTNCYILNLAVADLCFLIGIPLLIFTMFYGQWIFGNWFCKLYMISQSITQLSTSYFLLIMSADRYIAVCHPIESPRFRNLSVSKVISLLLWAFSFLLMSPVILYANTIKKSENGTERSCIIKWNLDAGSDVVDEPYAFILYSFVLGFAIPLALIMTFYYLVIKKLKSLRSKTKSKERKRSHRKVTKLVLIIIAMYVCFWTPHWILQIYTITLPPEHCKTKVEIVIFMLFGCLVYLNSSLNPLLYAFLSDSFKKHFVKACTCADKKDFHIFAQTDSPIASRFSKTRSSEKRHYSSVLTRINRNENRYQRKKETASAAATDESKEIILITTNVNRKEVLQTDL